MGSGQWLSFWIIAPNMSLFSGRLISLMKKERSLENIRQDHLTKGSLQCTAPFVSLQA